MTQWIKKPEYAESVVVPNNEFGDHPMHNWAEVPDWLQKAFDDRVISPRFGGEDYWYYDVKSHGRTYPASPDDLIVRDSHGHIDVRKKYSIEAEYDVVEDSTAEVTSPPVPVYLPRAWSSELVQIGTAKLGVDNTQVIITVDIPNLVDARVGAVKRILNGDLALSFIMHEKGEV